MNLVPWSHRLWVQTGQHYGHHSQYICYLGWRWVGPEGDQKSSVPLSHLGEPHTEGTPGLGSLRQLTAKRGEGGGPHCSWGTQSPVCCLLLSQSASLSSLREDSASGQSTDATSIAAMSREEHLVINRALCGPRSPGSTGRRPGSVSSHLSLSTTAGRLLLLSLFHR